MLRGRRHKSGGYEDPQTEATLRVALTEPAAPGEDESYRRLMAVIADDLRLRQPVRQHNWSWIPTTSVALAGMILSIIAYDAGVQHGRTRVTVAVNPPPVYQQDTSHPRAIVVPPANPPKGSGVKVEEVPQKPAATSRNSIALSFSSVALSKDEQDFVGVADRKADNGDWEGAATTLVQMADKDPKSDVAITAVDLAAGIRKANLKDGPGALALYQRERKMCDDVLTDTQDADRRDQLTKWRDRADAGVQSLNAQPQPDASPSTDAIH
jgi:hypothetical protein